MHPLEFRPGLRYVLERVVRSPRESVIKMHTSLQQDEDLSRTLISPSRRPRESTGASRTPPSPHRTAAVSMVAAGTNRPDQEFCVRGFSVHIASILAALDSLTDPPPPAAETRFESFRTGLQRSHCIHPCRTRLPPHSSHSALHVESVAGNLDVSTPPPFPQTNVQETKYSG